MVVAYVLYYF